MSETRRNLGGGGGNAMLRYAEPNALFFLKIIMQA